MKKTHNSKVSFHAGLALSMTLVLCTIELFYKSTRKRTTKWNEENLFFSEFRVTSTELATLLFKLASKTVKKKIQRVNWLCHHHHHQKKKKRDTFHYHCRCFLNAQTWTSLGGRWIWRRTRRRRWPFRLQRRLASDKSKSHPLIWRLCSCAFVSSM